MKTRKPLFVLSGIIIVLSFVLLSCGTSVKTAVACPEFSRYRTNRTASHQVRYKNKILTTDNRTAKHNRNNKTSLKHKEEYILTSYNAKLKNTVSSSDALNVSGITKIEYNEGLLASLDNHIIPAAVTNYYSPPVNSNCISEKSTDLVTLQSPCDTIVLSSGSVLLGKVEEIGQTEIKYRKCDNLNGPLISILKSDIRLIKYSNGTHDSIASDKPIPIGNPDVFTRQTPVNAPAKTEGLAIAGFISGIVGLFVAGIPLGTIAVVFGAISINKIRNYPARFKGRGLAIASIVIGIVAVAGAIIVLAAM
jgi:hypothetical protein